MQLLSGIEASNHYYEKLKNDISKLYFRPKLVAILVGNNKASKTYLKYKRLALEKLGLEFELITVETSISNNDLLKIINNLNLDKNTHGIIVQLPISDHLDEYKILNSISPSKDVDCLTDINIGKFFVGKSELYPATAKGVIRLLEYYKIDLEGKKITVIGRSNLVTKPLAIALVSKNATVTICHSKTKELKNFTKNSDIVISGIGKAKFLKEDYFDNNQILIDIGTSIDITGKLSGDIDFENIKEKSNYITPVPGGVGPMTIYGLIENLILLSLQSL